MSVLIDSSVWSLSLRRHRRDLNAKERAIVMHCGDLTNAGRAFVIGPICQETLSGIANRETFDSVRERLALIDEIALNFDTHVLASQFFNTCRRGGTSPGAIDMMICAAAYMHDMAIFSTDPDFVLYAKHLPITLHEMP